MARGTLTAFGQVAAGAVAGGAARIALTELWPASGYPWVIVAINVAGSVAIGWFAGAFGRDWRWWPFVGPGVFGGFTTFSALAVVPFATAVDPALAVAVLAASIVVCAVGAAAGLAAAGRGGARPRGGAGTGGTGNAGSEVPA